MPTHHVNRFKSLSFKKLYQIPLNAVKSPQDGSQCGGEDMRRGTSDASGDVRRKAEDEGVIEVLAEQVATVGGGSGTTRRVHADGNDRTKRLPCGSTGS